MRLKIRENLRTANLNTENLLAFIKKSTAFFSNHRICVMAVKFLYPKRWIIDNSIRNSHALIVLLHHHHSEDGFFDLSCFAHDVVNTCRTWRKWLELRESNFNFMNQSSIDFRESLYNFYVAQKSI